MARILLIDDDPLVRTALSLALSHFGHVVTQAGNGKEGLQLFQDAEFDLLITDIVMPEMEGFEFLGELRKKHHRVKVIAISGGGLQSGDDYLRVAKLLGATKVLTKPFSADTLMVTVNELLPDGKAPPSSAH